MTMHGPERMPFDDEERELLESLLDEHMADDLRSPDLTRRIMGRLGYMHVSSEIARKHQLRQWGQRAVVLVMLGAVSGISFLMQRESDSIRRPVELPLSNAVSNDLQRSGQRIESIVETLREQQNRLRALPARLDLRHAPDADAGDSDRPLDNNINHSAVAPYKWV